MATHLSESSRIPAASVPAAGIRSGASRDRGAGAVDSLSALSAQAQEDRLITSHRAAGQQGLSCSALPAAGQSSHTRGQARESAAAALGAAGPPTGWAAWKQDVGEARYHRRAAGSGSATHVCLQEILNVAVLCRSTAEPLGKTHLSRQTIPAGLGAERPFGKPSGVVRLTGCCLLNCLLQRERERGRERLAQLAAHHRRAVPLLPVTQQSCLRQAVACAGKERTRARCAGPLCTAGEPRAQVARSAPPVREEPPGL